MESRILLLGDIHANYPALHAVETYIRPERFDWIVNTGDWIVYSTFPNETIQWFRERKNTLGILGNTDRRILSILKGKRLKKPKTIEKRVMYFWTSKSLTHENIAYLKSLPGQADVCVGHTRIGIFHGTLENPEEALTPSTPEDRFRELARQSPYRVHVMGHAHLPYHKIIDGVHFINPGSVGRMFDGDSRASFATLTMASHNIAVEHFRIPYAVEKVVEGLECHGLPAIYGNMYRTGRKLN